jgi:cold shock CspA family protein
MATPMLSGCVKWFNSRHKYGFITVTSEGEYKNVDLFVHQSNLNTKEPCYRFLIAGENVKFEVKITTDEKHPSQAVNVSEMNGGSLKCELPRQHNSSYQPREHNSTHNGDGGYNRSEGSRARSFSSAGGRGGFRGSNGVGGFSSGDNNSSRGAGGFRGRGGSRGGGEFGRSRFGVQERVSSTPSVNTDTA